MSMAEIANFPTVNGYEARRWCPTGSGEGFHVPASKRISDMIADRVAEGNTPYVSFEYFPPRTAEGVTNLYGRLDRMVLQKPLFVDFTWGAGGSTSDLTVELCATTKAKHGVDVNMHMTCTNQEASKCDEGLRAAVAAGIRNICALRGDPPLGQEKWEATEGGFTCALDLIKHIRSSYGEHFGISCSGYPEGHPDRIKPAKDLGRDLTESEKGRAMVTAEGEQHVCSDEDYEIELNYLKEKVDAGADVIITQLFYDTEVFLQFVRDCRAKGINAPVLPGIMVIQAYGGFKRMTGFCKTRVPQHLADKMEELKDDADAVKAFGIQYGTDLCKTLLASGLVHGLHFYTLNLEKSTFSIMENLGLKQATGASGKVGDENENTFAGTLINTVIKQPEGAAAPPAAVATAA